jgi:hypothetical protein
MAGENFQLTSDPPAVEKIAKLKADLGGKVLTATVETHSGITYSGFVSRNYFKERTAPGKPRRVGGYIVLNAQDGPVRLDALDIKSWSFTP